MTEHDHKPPLGAKPRWLWGEQRIVELAYTITHNDGNGQRSNVAKIAQEIADTLDFIKKEPR
jgi:hypothetical protein